MRSPLIFYCAFGKICLRSRKEANHFKHNKRLEKTGIFFSIKMEETKITQTRKTSKFTAVLLALTIFFSVLCIAGTTSASAATERVSLYSSGVSFTKYGASTYEVFIQTKDNAANQKVTVHYYYMPTIGWADTEAEYVTTLSDGSKIWKAVFSSFDCQYAIKYEADGETIWDNNNGNDYNGTEKIGTAPVAAERLSGLQYNLNAYQVNAVLQNYAYDKNVFVRYTTDGWNTYNDQQLNYVNTNDNGSETWSTKLSLGTFTDYSDFEYAICY